MLRHAGTLRLSLFLLLCVATSSSRAAAPEVCEVPPSPRGKAFEVGLAYQAIVPSGLPDLTKTLPILGPVLGMPFIGGTLQLQGLFGSDASVTTSLSLFEANYRLELEIPFFHLFAFVGCHYLHYKSISTEHDGFGMNFGFGLAFQMGKNLELALSLRTYLQSRSTVSFGGGFSFLL